MAKWMSCKGVGSRFSILVRPTPSKRGRSHSARALLGASALAAAIGCSTSEGESATAPPAAGRARDTEQVVQRMAPEPAHGAGSAEVSRAGGTTTLPSTAVSRDGTASTGAIGSNAADKRISSAGVSRVNSRPSSAGEPITSKHLEAELDRLEAELAN